MIRFDPYETERRDLFNATITRLEMIPAPDSCYESLDVIANDPDTSSE